MIVLFKPLGYSLKNRFFPSGKPSYKTLAVLLFGLLLVIALFFISLRIVGYFHRQNELGIILSLKIFQMSWTILFAMLVFSSMVSGVSALFLSRDNEILQAAPIPVDHLFTMRYLTTTIYTSWMMVIFSLPIYSAFGWIFDAGPGFVILLLISLLSTAAMANGLGLAIIIVLINLFPARRTRDIVFYLSLLFSILLFLVFRLIKPEDLADPDKFPDFMDYLSALQTPASPLLPSSWASNLLTHFLQSHQADWLLLFLLLLSPIIFFFFGNWLMQKLFFPGYSKSQESFGGYRGFKTPRYSGSTFIWFLRKELKLFVRDSAEWSQLFLIGALVVIYLYNFKALPIDRSPMPTEYLTNLIAYANIGLTGFLIASLAARFVYPSIGAEGRGFGLIRSGPLSMWKYLGYKYFFYCIPFILLALTLLIASNHLLEITGPMAWISTGTGIILTANIVAIALGFGSIYADFTIENRAAVQGSFGMIFYLFSALTFELIVIALGTIPAYRLTRSWLRNGQIPGDEIATYGIMALAVVTCAVAISLFCIHKGIQKLTGVTEGQEGM